MNPASLAAAQRTLGDATPVHVYPRVDSTNQRAIEAIAAGESPPFAYLADAQDAGRGRRGRAWLSPPGCNLYLSLALAPATSVAGLGAFALVVASELADVVCEAGVDGVRIKWPNDLLINGAKLAGILCETATGPRGTCLVAGVGLNVRMPPAAGVTLDRRWTTVEQHTSLRVRRGDLAANLVVRLVRALPRFDADGLEPWLPALRSADALRGQQVQFSAAGGPRTGIAEGIDASGGLVVRTTDGARRLVTSGEVERLAPQRDSQQNPAM